MSRVTHLAPFHSSTKNVYAQTAEEESKTRKCDVRDCRWSLTMMSVFIFHVFLTPLDQFSAPN